MERTDTAKRSRKPEIVILGGKEYEIFPKPLSQSRPWKAKAKPHIEQMQKVISNFSKSQSKKETIELSELVSSLFYFMTNTIDELIELVFEWEPTLPKDEILEDADEQEFIQAIVVVTLFAFPFLQMLGINRAIIQGMFSNMPNQQ